MDNRRNYRQFTTAPFDAAATHNATVEDIAPGKGEWFLQRAQYMRDYALSDKTPVTDVLPVLFIIIPMIHELLVKQG